MKNTIQIVGATGEGDTLIGAFDNALAGIGIENYNLIKLSSVVPHGVTVQVLNDFKEVQLEGKWGDKLYVVMAVQYATEKGEEAHAGIGWAFNQEDTKQGLFVEHEGTSHDYVSRSIDDSLNNLFETRGMSMVNAGKKITSAICTDRPICAMTVAIYESEGWKNLSI